MYRNKITDGMYNITGAMVNSNLVNMLLLEHQSKITPITKMGITKTSV